MNWADVLTTLPFLYIGIGIIIGVCIAIHFINKETFGQTELCISVESIVCWGPAVLILLGKRLKRLIVYLWSREYREWFVSNKEAFKKCYQTRKRLRDEKKAFNKRQKEQNR